MACHFHTNSHLQPCELNINHTAGVDKSLVCTPWTGRLRVRANNFSSFVAWRAGHIPLAVNITNFLFFCFPCLTTKQRIKLPIPFQKTIFILEEEAYIFHIYITTQWNFWLCPSQLRWEDRVSHDTAPLNLRGFRSLLMDPKVEVWQCLSLIPDLLINNRGLDCLNHHCPIPIFICSIRVINCCCGITSPHLRHHPY